MTTYRPNQYKLLFQESKKELVVVTMLLHCRMQNAFAETNATLVILALKKKRRRKKPRNDANFQDP